MTHNLPSSLIADGVMTWTTHSAVYNFQSEYGLDFDGWKIRFDKVNAVYFMDCLQDGEIVKMSMKEYDAIICNEGK